MRIETYRDPELGTIGVAYNEAGEIVATAADVTRDGVRMFVDEGAFFDATGHLLPVLTAEQIATYMREIERPL